VAVVEHVDLTLVDVTADHVVTEMGEAGSRGEADVAGTDHTEANVAARHRRKRIQAVLR
jgi:hypothetical protein